MNYQKQAQESYDRLTPSREQWEKMGMVPRGAMGATVAEIASHLQMVDEVGQEYDIRLDPNKVAFGSNRAQVSAIAEAKVRQRKRSAGARALSRKYGKEAAERIIYRKTGKHVTLKH